MVRFAICAFFVIGGLLADEPPVRGVFNAQTGLHRYDGCVLNETHWADGDSFSIRLNDGKDYTIRVYGADCLETSGQLESDARRLRQQRRYFGISRAGGNARTSNEQAKAWGRKAKERVVALLSEPFSIHTAWADARGSARFKRYYGFVTTSDGRDLAAVLVEEGLARAYGVYRRTPEGESAAHYRETMRDLELRAAVGGHGIWQLTDWSTLPAERRAERDETAELEAAKVLPSGTINPNEASRDQLMTLPGIGEKTALAIIEERVRGHYRGVEDLRRVRGIGKATSEKLRPFLHFGGTSPDVPEGH